MQIGEEYAQIKNRVLVWRRLAYCLRRKGIWREKDTGVDIYREIKHVGILSRPMMCLEVGSGSGVIITSLAKALGSSVYLSTDINPDAAAATKAVSHSNNTIIQPIVADLMSCFLGRLENLVDILLFNPPYVVTESEEIRGDKLQVATAGGVKGREVIDRFLPCVPQMLSPKGLFYLVCIRENNIDELLMSLKPYGIIGENILERRCGIEFLHVLRFSHRQNS